VTRSDIRNIPASVRARLLARAKQQGESFDQILVYFAIERFLFRLAQTPWGDRLVVKGATMLRAWGTPLGRPTRDIDFSGTLDNSPEAVVAVVGECLKVPYPADGLSFDDTVEATAINVMDRYPGVRAIVTGNLDGALFKLQLDIGIDNVVVPDPEWIDYPTLLDLEAPRILAYMPAAAIAEKFETMVNLGLANSRMKDFYDVWLLSRVHEFAGAELVSAFGATFAHRGTDIPENLPLALTPAFFDGTEARSRWTAFITRSRVEAPRELAEVCAAISLFVMPVAVAARSNSDFLQRWVPGTGWRRR
jgi:hypothetical protein